MDFHEKLDLPHQPPIQLITILRVISVFVVLAAILGLLTFSFHQILHGGAFGLDYFVYWNAGRALANHQDPYSNETTLISQIGAYGHPALPGQDPIAFAYPLYSLFAILPTVGMEYEWAQPAWMAFNLIALIGFATLGLNKSRPWFIFTLPFIYNFGFGIILGNICILISSILIFCLGYFCVSKNQAVLIQMIAGVLLGWITAKPQYSWAFVGFFVIFAYKNRLFPLLYSILISTISFNVISFAIMPAWLWIWLTRVAAYATVFSGDRTTLTIVSPFLPTSLEKIGEYGLIAIAVLGTIVSLFSWWSTRISTIQCIAWVSLITFLLLPNNRSGEQTVLLIPIILWLGREKDHQIEKWITWAFMLIGSYASFFISKSGLYPPAIQITMFILFVVWLSFVYIRDFRFRQNNFLPFQKKSPL
jgi:hypothetical protein